MQTPEQKRAYRRRYYEKNREKMCLQAQVWGENNRERHRETTRLWRENNRGKVLGYNRSSAAKLRNYRKTDKMKGHHCDLTLEAVEELVSLPCEYCKSAEAEYPRGLDRLDNERGHEIGNVVPCCWPCNLVRSNRYTPAQMRIIGPAIAAARLLDENLETKET